eukprot:TRINITY_DN50471_c0_g1_i1.p1 TRINITY_DN50471_c0_g1~~TRINITY_DN50471_c0_g1_i1.p1  ORF type:complete len:421 (+),score=79.02 TRINITY_DN50471_c0_g1_i1:72-1334(+)
MVGKGVLLLFVLGLADANQWGRVDGIIQNYFLVPNASFSAGDVTGRKHTFVKKGSSINMSTPLPMASSSKFPVALAIAGVVNKGQLSFDTPVHKVFSWWTSSADDKRSRITLRHLLSFTDGIVTADVGGGGIPCLDFVQRAWNMTPEACAEQIYNMANFTDEPGTSWSYHSLHLQLAGAVAAKAANLSMQELLEEHLIKPLNMTQTRWTGYPNPHLAAAMVSSGDDYDKLLQAVLSYSLLPKQIIDEMEKDYITKDVKPAAWKDQFLVSVYGHYSMCIYFECFLFGWSEKCQKAGVHADPGAFGFWPLIDRSKGYYMQIVTKRDVTIPKLLRRLIDNNTAAALPAIMVAPMRYFIQGFVERALGKKDNLAAVDSLSEMAVRHSVNTMLERVGLDDGQRNEIWLSAIGDVGDTPVGKALLV